jgi:UDP-glucose 4-epimerase
MDADEALGKVFNIGSDQPVSIRELAERVVAAAGRTPPSPLVFQSYAEAYDDDFEDIRRRVPDLSRLKATIGYQPQYHLEAIIRSLVSENVGHSLRE